MAKEALRTRGDRHQLCDGLAAKRDDDLFARLHTLRGSGVQGRVLRRCPWMPAFAGMTKALEI
jgi:hypothetical protein